MTSVCFFANLGNFDTGGTCSGEIFFLKTIVLVFAYAKRRFPVPRFIMKVEFVGFKLHEPICMVINLVNKNHPP